MLDKLLNLYVLFYCMIAAGVVGAVGMFLANRSYKRKVRLAERLVELKARWMNLWQSRDVLLHRMNRWVWYPSLACTFFLGAALILQMRSGPGDGLALRYIYAGVMVPLVLLLLRQALDFSYREELLVDSIADYVENVQGVMEEKQIDKVPLKAQEELVEHIARSIKESAATTGGFGQFLTPEEENVMREVIREFMA